MKYQTALNEKYADLCKQLGDLVVKQKQVSEAIEKIESEISMLNNSAPMLQQIENQILADLLKPNQDVK